MKYILHPSVNITILNENKIQISNVCDSITIEGHNSTVQQLVELLENGIDNKEALNDYPDSLIELFELFGSRHFLASEAYRTNDALVVHLDAISQFGEKETKQTIYPKKVPGNVINLFGQGALADRVVAECERLAIHVIRDPLPSELSKGMIICLSDTPNDQLFVEINKLALQIALPALFAYLDEESAIVGPLVVPDETACYRCYQHRNFPGTEYVSEYLANMSWRGNAKARQGKPAIYAMEVAYHVISQMLKYQTGTARLCLINEILDLNLIDYNLNVRPILRVPNCENCKHEKLDVPLRAIRNLV